MWISVDGLLVEAMNSQGERVWTLEQHSLIRFEEAHAPAAGAFVEINFRARCLS